MSLPPDTRVLRVQYFVYFGVLGVFLPYFNLYCYHLNFSGAQIGALTGVRSAVVVLFALLWSAAADRLQARRRIFILCSLATAALWSLYLGTDRFGPMLAVTVAYGIFYAPLISFLEAFSMEVLGAQKTRYGRLRVWGSISFILTVLAVGRLLDRVSIGAIVPLILAGSAVQALVALRMPRLPAAGGGRPRTRGLLRPLLRVRVGVFLLCAFLMLLSHGTYYGFFSIHLEDLGFDPSFIGLAWALGSVAEILVMVGSSRLLGRFSLPAVLVVSMLAAALRWWLVSIAVSPLAVLLTQLLHAATYGAFHVASIVYIDGLMPPESRTLGQAANNAVTYGLGLIVGFFVNGWLFETVGSAGLFAGSSVVALAGALILVASLWLARRTSPPGAET